MKPLVHYGPMPCGPLDYAGTEDEMQVTCPECRRINGLALTTLTDGTQVYPQHVELKPDGQQRDYVVLSESERERGFVRPVRRTYVHQKCGAATTMSEAIAETYARDPSFYGGTFCCACRSHFPVGEGGEFVWDDGSKVGT